MLNAQRTAQVFDPRVLRTRHGSSIGHADAFACRWGWSAGTGSGSSLDLQTALFQIEWHEGGDRREELESDGYLR